MQKQADTFSNRTFDSLLNVLVFFFGVDIDEIKDLPENTLLEKIKELQDVKDQTPLVQDERERSKGLPQIKDVEEVTDVVWVEQPELDEGKVIRNQYKINIPPMLASRLGDPKVDHSYPALKYLESLGYKTFDFFVNPHHRKNDICDEVQRAGTWDLVAVLNSAVADSETGGVTSWNTMTRGKPYPVAPIFFLTHPGSRGRFHVHPPTTVDEIPDDAPGLVDMSNDYNLQWFDYKALDEEKRQLLQRLKEVEVNSFTLPPDMFEKVLDPIKEEFESQFSPSLAPPGWLESSGGKDFHSLLFLHSEDIIRMKQAVERVEVNKPIKLKENIYIKLPNGFIQMLIKDFRGFLIEKINDIGKVYINEIENFIYTSLDNVEELAVTDDIGNNKIKENDFIRIEDSIGIALSDSKEGEELIAFLPEYMTFVGTDEWQRLEIS